VQLGGITVSLLRAPKYPDPSADHGRHHVRLAVLPHGPGLHEVLAEAEALNLPLRLVEGTATQPLAGPVVTVDHPGVQLSAVKAADDGSADLIVRCYEACGTRSPVTLSLRSPIGAATRCDLMEEPLAGGGIEVGDGVVALTLTPFELVTLRLTPR
jgi:alpha-mannosidase